MEATNMMRKMMAAASLVAIAACGSNETTGDGDGTGGACSSGSDCGESEACDMNAHVCVADQLTVDPSDFAVQSSIWWTNTAEPTLRGSFEGDASTTIEVRIGEGRVVAQTQASAWNAKLPAGSIATSKVPVTIALSDGTGRSLEAVRTLGLDAAPPAITLGQSLVYDERADVIDFSSGEPVHTHGGTPIDLADGCQTFAKYAYLMSASGPTFGRQTAKNPLAWNLSIADAKLDPTATAYRVRDTSGRVLLDWTSLATTPDDTYRIELYRDGEHGIRELGTTQQQLTLDVRARDWTGLESVASYCWRVIPLAAPLGFEQTTANSSLFGMSFAAGSPISTLMGDNTAAIAASQEFVQYTAEPIVLDLAKPATAPHYSKTYVDDYIQIGTSAGGVCDSVTCDTSPVPDPADVTTTGTVGFSSETFALYDVTADRYVFGDPARFVIPARAANEPPHRYRIDMMYGALHDLRPANALAVGEYQLTNIRYTGLPVTEYLERCTHVTTRCPHGVCVDICDGLVQYARMVALDEAQLDFDPIAWTARTSPTSALDPIAQAYAPASLFSTGPLVWTTGNADLPGLH